MNWFRKFWLEVWGLFVDDGSLAVAIVLWVVIAAFLLPRFVPERWKGPVLFIGLVVILIENVSRSARRLRKE